MLNPVNHNGLGKQAKPLSDKNLRSRLKAPGNVKGLGKSDVVEYAEV
jgi:hypothetical protein